MSSRSDTWAAFGGPSGEAEYRRGAKAAALPASPQSGASPIDRRVVRLAAPAMFRSALAVLARAAPPGGSLPSIALLLALGAAVPFDALAQQPKADDKGGLPSLRDVWRLPEIEARRKAEEERQRAEAET